MPPRIGSVQMNFRTSPTLKARLAETAYRENTTLSELLDRIITEYVLRMEAEAPPSG